MKRIVWFAAAIVLLAFLFPEGVKLPTPTPAPTPEPPAVVVVDDTIVSLLANADRADKARIVSVYEGLRHVLARDQGARVNTTEKLAELQANTLQLAIESPGKYPGLDEAIETSFVAAMGTDDVLSVTPEVVTKLLAWCDLIINSAKK
jgi:hypothetical protein